MDDLKEVKEVAARYLTDELDRKDTEVIAVRFAVFQPEALVLVRASLGDFALHLMKPALGPIRWEVVAELDAEDYHAPSR